MNSKEAIEEGKKMIEGGFESHNVAVYLRNHPHFKGDPEDIVAELENNGH